MQHTINLAAGVRQRMQIAGAYLAVLSITGAASVQVSIVSGTETLEEIRTMARGMTLQGQAFDSVELLAQTACTVELVIGTGRVTVNTMDGAVVQVTATAPLPVSNDRGSPGNLLHVTGVSVADAPATSVPAAAPVAITPAGVAIVAANASRRALRFLNLGPDPVAIGPTGQTWAQRVLVLQPGDVLIEDRAANLAWAGVTDTGKAASVTAQEVLA